MAPLPSLTRRAFIAKAAIITAGLGLAKALGLPGQAFSYFSDSWKMKQYNTRKELQNGVISLACLYHPEEVKKGCWSRRQMMNFNRSVERAGRKHGMKLHITEITASKPQEHQGMVLVTAIAERIR